MINDPTVEQPFYTDAWGGKFRYGACSTLISSWVLRQNDFIVAWLQDPVLYAKELDDWLPRLKEQYQNISRKQYQDILASALGNNDTTSIFDESRDFCRTDGENVAFMAAMRNHPELKPIDNFYADPQNRFIAQYNVHRGLYHNAYGIPQNSVAAVFNAYLAGIRSVEFDVLETRDHVSIVLHDLVTNRLDASFDEPPKFAALWTFAELYPTPVGILDPLADSPKVTPTKAANLVSTRDLLWAVRRWMPELTLYADARNSAPVSLLKLLHDEPGLREGLVMKVYPFELGGGVYDLVTEYARRYAGGDDAAATKQIRAAAARFLLAMNSLTREVAERVTKSELLGLSSTFNWGTKVYVDDRPATLSTQLPYTTDSVLKPKNGARSYNRPWGDDLFTADEIEQIQGRTFLATHWAIDFSTLGSVRVFQVGLTPSLVGLIDADDKAGVTVIPAQERMISAVTDNFLATFELQEGIDVTLVNRLGHKSRLHNCWSAAVFGTADRFPDFAFATRKADGTVDQASLIDGYYDMVGRVYKKEKNDYAAKLMRSTKAIEAAMITWPHVTRPLDCGGYITTDLPTDLRTLRMGLSGQEEFPRWMDYRVGGVLKPQYYPGQFIPQPWSTELFGRLRRDHADFGKYYDAITNHLDELKPLTKALDALLAYHQCPVVIVDQRLLQILGAKGWFTRVLSDAEFESISQKLKSEVDMARVLIRDMQNDFAQKFGVHYDGTPVKQPLTEVLIPPDANWDH